LLDSQIKQGIFNHLASSLMGQVSLDVWLQGQARIARIDQDECTHCEDVKNVSRDISNLHPGISITYYDIEKHSDRALEENIEHVPTTILRGNARKIKFIGFWWGSLFPAFLDILITLGNGMPVLGEENQKIINEIENDTNINLYVSPFENLSTNQMIILANIVILSKKVHLNIYEMSEFPILAKNKNITKIPTIEINTSRIEGGLEEKELCEQISKVSSGNADIILKLDNPSMPYISEEEAKKMQGAQANNQENASKLILPGQE